MGNNVSELIRRVETADSPPTLVKAVGDLVAAQSREGIPTLIATLGYNNPEAALMAVQGLIDLGDVAVPQLIELIDDYNYGARAYSFRAIATIAHPQALDTLINAALTDFSPSVRRAAAAGLGKLRFDELPPSSQKTAIERSQETLTQLTADSDWGIRYAAIVGLQLLAKNPTVEDPNLVTKIANQLQELSLVDGDVVIKARSTLALTSIEA
jgi:phycocyanobilin lyase beta subunit